MIRLTIAIALLSMISVASPGNAEVLVVHAGELHTGAGEVVKDATIVVRDGRIESSDADTTPAGAREIRAAVVTPGFIDAHTSAGLSGLRNVAAVLDQDERTNPDGSALRALDAFDPHDPLLRFLLEHGVTVVQTGPGPANPIGGQAGIFRTHGESADAMVVRFPSAMIFNLGEIPKATYKESRGSSTRMGTAALIRGRLLAGRHYADQRRSLFGDAPEPDPGLEALGRVANGELPAIFNARRADDIETALRLTRELSLTTALAGATEAYRVRDAILSAGVPVFVGPVMERVSTPETENASYENAAFLADTGIPIAIRSGFESYVPKNRVLLFEATVAVANGLSRDRALHAISLGPAELLGIDDDYGSVEPGKVADLALFDGDPFEYTSHVTAVVAGGEVLFER
jgi:imidazolonepropionase-like amidohydrolase